MQQLIVKTMVWILLLPNTPASRRLRFPARTADDDDDNNNNARDDDANNNYDDDGGADERTSFSINDGNDVFQFNSPLPTRKKTLLAERSPRERAAAAAAAAAAAETAAAVHRRATCTSILITYIMLMLRPFESILRKSKQL